jgi:hypothetical protein
MFYIFLLAVLAMIAHQVIYYKKYLAFSVASLLFIIMFAVISFDGGGVFSLVCVTLLGILSLKPWQ